MPVIILYLWILVHQEGVMMVEYLRIRIRAKVLFKTLNIPSSKEIDTVNSSIPYYAVENEPLLKNLMRHFLGIGKIHLSLNESMFNIL